ncbi:hypothetical protein [Clostridium sp.]
MAFILLSLSSIETSAAAPAVECPKSPILDKSNFPLKFELH